MLETTKIRLSINFSSPHEFGIMIYMLAQGIYGLSPRNSPEHFSLKFNISIDISIENSLYFRVGVQESLHRKPGALEQLYANTCHYINSCFGGCNGGY